jgi:hypothetical protein
MGFDSTKFLNLHFSNFSDDSEETFIQSAMEEGPYMGQLARDLLTLLDWPIGSLESHATHQILHRPTRVRKASPQVVYITGDNCDQPTEKFLKDLVGGRENGY